MAQRFSLYAGKKLYQGPGGMLYDKRNFHPCCISAKQPSTKKDSHPITTNTATRVENENAFHSHDDHLRAMLNGALFNVHQAIGKRKTHCR